MKELASTLATMVGMLPSTGTSLKELPATAAQIQGWMKGVVFALSAIAVIISMITSGVWVARVLAPRLLGLL